MATKTEKQTNDSVYKRVEALVREQLCIDKSVRILCDHSLELAFGMDSMDQVVLCDDLEFEFDITIPYHEIMKLKTFGDIVNYIIEQVKMVYAIITVDEKFRVTSVSAKGDYNMEFICNEYYEKTWKTYDGAEKAMHRIWDTVAASRNLLKVVKVLPCR